jgi:hypothetical protein
VKRVVALIVAVGLVIGAVAIRRAIDDDTTVTTEPSGSDPSRPAATGKVLCAGDLGDVCATIADSIIENPAVTVDRLAKGEPLGADAWIASAPWPQIASERARLQGRSLALTLPTTPIARTPLSFFLLTASADAIRGQCGGVVDWKCLLRSSPSVRIDFDDPLASTAGLLAVIQQASSFFGTADFGSNDFRLFDRELAQLKSGRATAPSGATVFERFGLFSHADVLTGLAAVGDQQLQRAQFKDRLVPTAANPPIAADIIIATTANSLPAKPDDVRSAFRKAGWVTSDLGPLSALPTADVMIALQDLWKGLR